MHEGVKDVEDADAVHQKHDDRGEEGDGFRVRHVGMIGAKGGEVRTKAEGARGGGRE